jgi:cysteine desulfurase
VNVSFDKADGEALLLGLDLAGVACSSGSACTSGAIDPSHVLLAMGVPAQLAAAALRFSLGRPTTREEVEQAVEIIAQVVQRVRG